MSNIYSAFTSINIRMILKNYMIIILTHENVDKIVLFSTLPKKNIFYKGDHLILIQVLAFFNETVSNLMLL